MQNNIPHLFHASLTKQHIQEALNDQKLIFLITSTPSYALKLKNDFPNKNIQSITGANHHEYQDVLYLLGQQLIDILVLGIEQLINPTKLDAVLDLIHDQLGFVMVDHVHHASFFNHDTKFEYLKLNELHIKLNHVPWYLYSHALSQADIRALSNSFDEITNAFSTHHSLTLTFYSANKLQQLQTLVNYANKGSVLVVAHDYLKAEMIANKLNCLVLAGVIHRKVEETTKVFLTKQWQAGKLNLLVTTSDTLLPFPYPLVDTVAWIEPPLNKIQLLEWHSLFNAKESIVIGNISDQSYLQASLHQVPYNETLNTIVKTIKDSPEGLTMREIEHYINIDTYTLEKALKGLRAMHAIKKHNSKYIIEQDWKLDASLSKDISSSMQEEHTQLVRYLKQHEQPPVNEISDNTIHVFNHVALKLRPRVLFPIGFYPKSLIPNHLMSLPGFVFEELSLNINQRADDIVKLIEESKIDVMDLSVVLLSKLNDHVHDVAKVVANRLNVPLSLAFEEFDSCVLSLNLNPYHKMKAIMNQIKLLPTETLKTTVVVIADHADHYWQMAVVAYELLSNSRCKKVMVVFNQP